MSIKDTLEKNWKAALLAMGMAGAPSEQSKEQATMTQVAQQPKQIKFDPSTLHNELHPIAHLESSFGKNMNHKVNVKGEMHTAIGPIGFKPITAMEEFNRTKHLKDMFPDVKDENKFLDEFKYNPHFYNLVAGAHWNRLKKLSGTPQKAAFMWRWGVTAGHKATPEQIVSDPYVQKYTALANGSLKGK